MQILFADELPQSFRQVRVLRPSFLLEGLHLCRRGRDGFKQRVKAHRFRGGSTHPSDDEASDLIDLVGKRRGEDRQVPPELGGRSFPVQMREELQIHIPIAFRECLGGTGRQVPVDAGLGLVPVLPGSDVLEVVGEGASSGPPGCRGKLTLQTSDVERY